MASKELSLKEIILTGHKTFITQYRLLVASPNTSFMSSGWHVAGAGGYDYPLKILPADDEGEMVDIEVELEELIYRSLGVRQGYLYAVAVDGYNELGNSRVLYSPRTRCKRVSEDFDAKSESGLVAVVLFETTAGSIEITDR